MHFGDPSSASRRIRDDRVLRGHNGEKSGDSMKNLCNLKFRGRIATFFPLILQSTLSSRAIARDPLCISRILQYTTFGECHPDAYRGIRNYNLMFSDIMIDLGSGVSNLFNNFYYEHLDWGHFARPGRSFTFFVKVKY